MQSQQHEAKPAPERGAKNARTDTRPVSPQQSVAEPPVPDTLDKAFGGPRSITPEAVITLQRTVGNQAVQRLIRQHIAPSATIQRNGKETAKKVASTTGEVSDITGAGLGAAKDIGSLIAEGGRAATGAGVASTVGGTVGAIKELGEAYSEGSKLKGVSGTTGLINAGAGAVGTFGSEAVGAVAGTVGGVTDVVGGAIKGGRGITDAYGWSKSGKAADKLKGESTDPGIQGAADKLSKIASYRYYLSAWDIGVGAIGTAGGGAALTGVAPLAAGLGLTSKILGADTTWSLLHWVAPNHVWTNDRYQEEVDKIETEIKTKAEDIIKTATVGDITALYKIAKDVAPGFAEELVNKIPSAAGRANVNKRKRLRQNLV